ncbi:MAG: L,D-transpeptidase [Leptolyngbyaceae cyanobacterium]
MLNQSAIRQCAMALCFGAAGMVASAAWQQHSPPSQLFWQPTGLHHFQRLLENSPVAAMVSDIHLVIRLADRELDLYEGETVVATYPVAIGQDEWETPVGHFAVLDMRQDPVWQHPITKEAVGPGPDNPLGSRWIGFAFSDEYRIGIHGTYAEDLVGQAVSHGCVRMKGDDIEALYAVLSIGTPLVVKP